MTGEIARLRGLLAVNEKLLETYSAGIDGDMDELRSLADKYENKADLKSVRIVVVAGRIHDQVENYRKVAEIIKRVKRDLGEA